MPEYSQFLQQFSYLGLFILLILGGIGLPFPEDAVLILSGFFIAHNMMKPVPAILTIYAGLILTDYFLYSMGKKYGRMIVTHKRFQRIVSPDKLAKIEKRFQEKGSLVILIGRHIVGLRAQLLIAAGIMRMPATKFLLADGITSIFTIVLMVGAGYAGGNSLQVIRSDFSRIEHVAIVLLVIVLSLYIVLRYFKSRSRTNA